MNGPFGGRNVIGVGDAFGEAFLYYASPNPIDGTAGTKVGFVKRVVVYGLPMLVGSGFLASAAHEGEGTGGEEGESGTQYDISETAREIRSGVELILSYNRTLRSFIGSVRNTTQQPVGRVRVEVHLSNGVELGPTPNVDLDPGQVRRVELSAGTQSFTGFSTHVEIGSGEGGGEGGGESRGSEGGSGGEHGSTGGGEGGTEGREGGGEHGSGGHGREGGGG